MKKTNTLVWNGGIYSVVLTLLMLCFQVDMSAQVREIFFEDFLPGFTSAGWTGNWDPLNPTAAGFWGPTVLVNSVGTGPDAGNAAPNSRNGFAHAEFETSGGVNGIRTFQHPFNWSTLVNDMRPITLSFDYFMFGAGVLDFEVEVSNDGGATWTSVFLQSGQQQTTGADDWLQASINLDAYDRQDIIIRFTGENTAASFTEDIEIDAVRVTAVAPDCDYDLSNVDPDGDGCVTFTNTAGTCQGDINLPAIPQPTCVVTPVTATLALLSEDFEDAAAVTGSWTFTDNRGGDGWTVTAAPGGGGNAPWDGSRLVIDDDAVGAGVTGDAQAISPVIDLAGLSGARLKYEVGYNDIRTWGVNDRLDVDVSGDGGATWTQVQTFLGDVGNGTQFINPLPAGVLTNQFQVRFDYTDGNLFAWYAAVDNLEIEVFSPDAAAAPITATVGVGTYKVTYSGTDIFGLTKDTCLNVKVIDTEAPSFDACPGNQGPFNLLPGECFITVNYDVGTLSDNCPIDPPVQIDGSGLTSGDLFLVGTTTQIWEATDISGNTAQCQFDVIVNGFASPTTTLSCNDFIQVSLDEDNSDCTQVGADMVLEGGPYACYLVNYTLTRTPTITGCPVDARRPGEISVNCNDIGKEITVRVTDDATGSSCWGKVIVEDKLPPVIDCVDAFIDCNADLPTTPSLNTVLPDPNGTSPLRVPDVFPPHPGGAFSIAGNNAPGGGFFDYTNNNATETIAIEGFSVRFGALQFGAVPDPSPVSVWVVLGGWTGLQNNGAAWTQVADMVLTNQGAMQEDFSVCMELPTPILITPGQTVGVFVLGEPNSILVTNQGGAGPYVSGDLEISNGGIIGGRFAGFFSTAFRPNYEVKWGFQKLEVPPSDNCDFVDVTVVESADGGSCATGTSGTVLRTWTATDGSGNTSSCSQTVTLNRPSIGDVDFGSDIITLDCSTPYPDTFASVCVKDTTTLLSGGGIFLPDGQSGLAFDIDPTVGPDRLLKDVNVSIGLEHLNVLETKLWLGRLDVQGNLIQTVKLFDPNPNLNYIKCSVNNKRDMIFTFDDESCPMPHEACANFSPTLFGQYQPMESLNDGYAGLPVNAHANPDWVLIYADTVISCLLTGNVQPCSENMGNLTDFSIEYLYEDANIVTTPTIAGRPFRSGDACGLTATYTDEVIDVCPTSYKIIRTWTVIDWCETDPAARTARFEQLIKVIDTCPPVLDQKRTRLNDNDTWDVPVYTPSTAAGAHTLCMGNATIPPVDVCYENCSGVATWKTELWSADGANLIGSVPTNGGTFNDLTLDLLDMHDDGTPDDKNSAALTFPIIATPNPFDSITIPGISTLNEPDAIYLARYTVTDACGNTSSLDCYIRLLDKVPPVPVCREETQLALTGFNGDTTTLCADDLDEGSYDNCGNVCFFIRKMVDADDTDPIGSPNFGVGPQPDLVFEIFGRDGAGSFDLARDYVYKNCTSYTCDDIGEDNQVFLLVVDDFVVNFVNDYLDNLFPFIDAVVDYNVVPLTILPYDKLDDEEDIFDVSDPNNIRIEADNDRHNRGKRYFEFYLNEDPNSDGLFVVPTAIIWDGHFNFCMVNVHVEDKVRPTCTPPADVWANCTDLPDNIDFTDTDQLTTLFGTAVADDNCGAVIEELNPNVQLDLCGVGTIRRSFRAEDTYGNRSIGACRQTIMIMPVNSYKLNVPGDYEEECVNSGPQDFLYEEYACDLIALNSEDIELLASTDGECKKIIRTWKMINWCEYDGASAATILPRLDLNNDGSPGDGNGGSNSPTRHNAMHMWVSNGDIMILNDNPNVVLPSTGRYEYEQHIKIFDNTAPEVDYDGDVKFCGGDLDEDPCTAEVEITPNVMDFCTNTTGRWELDAFSTRFFDADFNGGGGSLTGRWPLGVHTVRFYFEDECGNISQFDVTFETVDCKAPTPVCHNGLSIDVMPLSGMVELWAVDFDASSFDYCSPFELRINTIEDRNGDGVITNDDYVNVLPADDFIILDCDDVNAGLTMVQLWVAEQDGTSDDACVDNQDNDYCVTFVEVQDNNGVCGGPKVALGGKVTNEENESVENVTIDLNVQGMNTITTSNDGEYLFPSLPSGGDYSVTPMRNDDVDNGVSTYDLVLISKHVLNVDLLDSPYKVVAADANKSGNISTLDLVAIRKVILRVENQFPNNTSWRFVDKAYAFNTIAGAAGESFPEVKNYNNLASDEIAADFIAVKIGDVSGDAIANSILGVDDRTFNGTLNLNAAEATAVAGEEFTVEFTADKNVLGYQFTLDYNEKAVELVDIVDGLASEAQNFNVTNGMIATSWNNDVATSNEVMFSLVFRAKSDVNVMDIMTVSSELTKAEAYGTDGDLMNIALNFGNTTSENEFALYQNTPNPFESETNIGFTLPEASSATITISDVAGKIVKVVKGDFAKGYNTVSLKRSDIGVATGVLSYQLETPTNSATKQMIIIE